MKSRLTAIVFILLGVLAVVSGAVWTLVNLNAQTSRPEYADAPFHPMSKDSPRILSVREWPSSRDEQNRYRAEQDRVRKYLREQGAPSRLAPAVRAAYDEATSAIQKGKNDFLKARELAGKVLDADRQSVVGHYVMAQVEHYGEANLPRALFEIRQARRLLEIHGQTQPGDSDAREWYVFVLNEEFSILDSMDRRTEQLQVVDLLDAVYQPMPWRRTFPLIKLHRLDEAERYVEAIEKDGLWPRRAMNMRIMLAEQRRDRGGVYQAGKATVKQAADSGVLWSNFGEACMNDFRIDEAEAAFLKSTRVVYDFYNSAHFHLAEIYLQKGRMTDAWQAVKQGQYQRGGRQPHTLQQDQSSADRAAALVLLALGKGEDAERFARRAVERPGRTGSTTFHEESQSFASNLLLWQALQTRIQQIQENDPSLSLSSEMQLAALRSESWTLRQKLVKALSYEDFLSATLRPYLPGLVQVDSWQLGSVLQLLPAGVAEEALARARAAEEHPSAPGCFDAMAAELALSQGRHEEALTLVRKTLETLPVENEKLLRARVAAVGAEAARQLGRDDEARSLFRQALRDFPQVFRMLGVRIPVRIEDDGSPLAHQFAMQLARSPMFRQDSNGFRLEVRQTGDKLTLTLDRAENERHVQVEIPTTNAEGQDATKASSRFHERVTSPHLDLTASEVNSLEQLSRPRG